MTDPEGLESRLRQPFRENIVFGYPIPNALIAVWLSCGPNFQLDHDIADDEAADDLMHWWLSAGRHSFAGVRDLLDDVIVETLHFDSLAAADPVTLLPMTPLLSLIARHRPDLAALGPPEAPAEARLWAWWLDNGAREYFGGAAGRLLVRQHHALARNLESGGVPVALAVLHALRRDLCDAFDLRQPNGRIAFIDWWRRYGVNERPDLAAALEGHALELSQDGNVSRAPAAAREAGRQYVSLFGYPRGEFGLGEDVRLLRSSLQHVGIEPAVVRAPWRITARNGIREPSIEASPEAFETDVMIYVMPAFDTTTLLTMVGPAAFAAPRKIGFWQWELARFPPVSNIAFDLVDEIWCHSEHAFKAFRAATDKPVVKVPLPVAVPQVERESRAAYGIPDAAFVVFTSFDGASSISRKNPLGAILAFEAAFADGAIEARLIVKAMNVAASDSLWRECLRHAVLDSRIIILDEVMERTDYYRLLMTCNAVLSMHRAEGFGRLMAEAMALGIPTIASAYSGNLDFMTADNSWLVGGRPVRLFPGDYAFSAGQTWFEPDIRAAAAALRECAENPAERHTRAIAARQTMSTRYALEVCGRAYTELLGRQTGTSMRLKA